MIIIDSNWVSTPWKWSVNLYKNRQGTDMYKRRNNTQNNKKTQIHKSKTSVHNKNTNIERILKT